MTAARTRPGVFAVITAADVPDRLYASSGFVADRPLFARNVVRYEGEVVAAVAAATPEAADAALRAIEIEYEDLPLVLDVERALQPGSPLVHENWASYAKDGEIVAEGNMAARSTIVKGDATAALGAADVVVRERYVADMIHPVPIEPHAILAEWSGDRVTIHSSSQVPFAARTMVAETLEIPQHRVRVVVSHLGGGFGGKCDFHYEAHVAALARAARRPVRVVFTRREEFTMPDKVGHGMVVDLETGLSSDGRIVARRGRILLDCGAYAADSPVLGQIACMEAVGPYRIPHVDLDARLVYTNRVPSGSVRAPTGPQTCWAVEGHTDELAARVGLDPVEFRRRNLVTAGDEGPTRQLFEPNGALRALDEAARRIGWGSPLPAGESIGIAAGWWFSMPSASGAFVRIDADGRGRIVTGAQENGTGAVMALAMLAGDELGMAPEDFAIVYQDTDAGPYDTGSAGSQTTFNAGRAVVEAAREVRTKVIAAAAEMLEAAHADLELRDGAISVVGSPDRRVTIGAVATQVQDDGGLLLGAGSGTAPTKPEHDASACVGRLGFEAFASPTFFCQAARVKVDRATGVVRVLEVAAVNDIGRVLNPRGAAGQITGGVVQAIGTALTEGTVYGTDGRQRNAALLDYKLPTAADAPTIDVGFIEAPAANGGPYGAKGVGEPPIVPTAGAIGNAIAAATGARVRRLPMTPERVWRAMREGSDGAADPGGPLAPAAASAGEPASGGAVPVGASAGNRR